MNTDKLLSQIQEEINRLTRVRDLLAGTSNASAQTSSRSTGAVARKPRTARKKRTMSAEGRARIAAAQKLRWAKVKRS